MTLSRICEHLEHVPHFDADMIGKILLGFRRICQEEASYLDPWSANRDELLGPTEQLTRALLRWSNTKYTIDHMTALLRTPRDLKMALRGIHSGWNFLRGEIDMDDLIAVHILKTGAPESFGYVEQNQQTLLDISEISADPQSDSIKEAQANKIKRLKERWGDIAGDVYWDVEAAWGLIEFLFPGLGNHRDARPAVRPQGVANSFPTNYWARLNAGVIPQGELRDQTVLSAINKWRDDHDAAVLNGHSLADLIYGQEGWAKKIEHFRHLLTGAEIRELAGQLFRLTLSQKGSRASYDTPGFIELWRMSLDAQWQNHDKWLLGQIRQAARTSLRFSNDLFYYWHCKSKMNIGSHQFPAELYGKMLVIIQKEIDGNTQILTSALCSKHPYTLRHLMVLYNNNNLKPKQWNWLANPLLAASDESPRVIVPQVACLLVDAELDHRHTRTLTFNKNHATRVFPRRLRKLMELLARDIQTGDLSEQASEAVLFARQVASTYLKSGKWPS